jgi:hypothetical protein
VKATAEIRHGGWGYKAVVRHWGTGTGTDYYRYDGGWRSIAWDAIPGGAYRKLRTALRADARTRSRYGNSESLSIEEITAYNGALAKLFQRLKKDAGAERIAQNYRGTGSQVFRRQLWVRFKSGAVIDLWLERHGVKFGGVVSISPGGSLPLPRGVAYEGKTPAQVYAEVAPMLRAWANPGAGSFRRRATR